LGERKAERREKLQKKRKKGIKKKKSQQEEKKVQKRETTRRRKESYRSSPSVREKIRKGWKLRKKTNISDTLKRENYIKQGGETSFHQKSFYRKKNLIKKKKKKKKKMPATLIQKKMSNPRHRSGKDRGRPERKGKNCLYLKRGKRGRVNCGTSKGGS